MYQSFSTVDWTGSKAPRSIYISSLLARQIKTPGPLRPSAFAVLFFDLILIAANAGLFYPPAVKHPAPNTLEATKLDQAHGFGAGVELLNPFDQ